jgi:hypothetical protein
MEETRSHGGLIYIGEGTTLEGVPARDLTAEEVAQFGREVLIACGLYQEREIKKVYTPKPVKSALKGNDKEIDNGRN